MKQLQKNMCKEYLNPTVGSYIYMQFKAQSQL